MKEGLILTLAMSETRKNQYNIVGYLKDIGEFVSFNATRYFANEKPLLDIGSYSKISYKEIGNNEIELGRDMILTEGLYKRELIEFLDEKKISLATFQRITSMKFAIVEVTYMDEIVVNKSGDTVDTYISAIINGQRIRVKVKDFRWVNYWNYVCNQNDINEIEDKKNKYKEFFNSRKTYILLFRFKNEVKNFGRYKQSNDVYWTDGIFYA